MYSFSPKIEFNILTLNLNLTKGKDLRGGENHKVQGDVKKGGFGPKLSSKVPVRARGLPV